MEQVVKERINWLDWARAITIFLVVLGHFDFRESNHEYRNFIYAFHVPLFFFLSGYLHKPISSFLVFIKKNIKSLLIPYIFFNVLILVSIGIPYFFLGKMSIDEIKYLFTNFLIGGIDIFSGPTWFLICLFNVKVISYFILKLKALFQLIVIVALVFITYIFDIQLYYSLGVTFYVIPFYMAGFYMKKYNLLENKDNKVQQFLLFVLACVLLIIGNNIEGRIDLNRYILGKYFLLFYLDAFIGSFMIIMLCKLLDDMKIRFIQVISSGTIVILGLHIDVVKYVSLVLLQIRKSFHLDFEFNILVIISLSVLVILILYYPILFLQKYFPFFIGNRK